MAGIGFSWYAFTAAAGKSLSPYKQYIENTTLENRFVNNWEQHNICHLFRISRQAAMLCSLSSKVVLLYIIELMNYTCLYRSTSLVVGNMSTV